MSCGHLLLSGTVMNKCRLWRMEDHHVLHFLTTISWSMDWAWKTKKMASVFLYWVAPERKSADRNQTHVISWNNKCEILGTLFFQSSKEKILSLYVSGCINRYVFALKLCKSFNDIACRLVGTAIQHYRWVFIFQPFCIMCSLLTASSFLDHKHRSHCCVY